MLALWHFLWVFSPKPWWKRTILEGANKRLARCVTVHSRRHYCRVNLAHGDEEIQRFTETLKSDPFVKRNERGIQVWRRAHAGIY